METGLPRSAAIDCSALQLIFAAPEYALESTLTYSNDLYSLGCVLYAVHMGGKPPFQNRGSMQSLRENVERSLTRRDWMSGSKWERCSSELRGKSIWIHLRHSVATDHCARHATSAFDSTSLKSPQSRITPFPLILLIPGDLHTKFSRRNDICF